MKNVVVLDLEVLNSPDWCKWCGASKAEMDERTYVYRSCPHEMGHRTIGWNDHAALGISIGCYYDYTDDRYHYFDTHNLGNTMCRLADREALVVSYNGRTFDLPLMLAVCKTVAPKDDWTHLEREWQRLIDRSYDILHEIWARDPNNRFQKGNGLDAVADANRYGKKLESGAYAPQLWREGQYARVVEYCTDDVWKTRKLFEQICRGEPIKRPAGAVLLPIPDGCGDHPTAREHWLAVIAYMTYGKTTDWKNYQELPMPDFDDLAPTIQRAWINASAAVRRPVVSWGLTKEEEKDASI